MVSEANHLGGVALICICSYAEMLPYGQHDSDRDRRSLRRDASLRPMTALGIVTVSEANHLGAWALVWICFYPEMLSHRHH